MLPSQISHIHSFAGLPSVYGQRPAYVQMQGKLIYPHTTSSDLLPLFHWFLSSISHEGGCEKLKIYGVCCAKAGTPKSIYPPQPTCTRLQNPFCQLVALLLAAVISAPQCPTKLQVAIFDDERSFVFQTYVEA